MTLFYWWMHWFWITSRIYLAVSLNDTQPTLHSILRDQTPITTINVTGELSTTTTAAAAKNRIENINPPIIVSPSNSSTWQNISKYQKPSLKKFDFIISNSSIKLNTTKMYSSSKETTVINQNVTDYSINLTDNQLINASIGAINHTDNLTYFGEDTDFNESLVLNYERVGNEDDEYDETNLSAAGITGITLGCVIIVGIICGVSYFLYRNRGFNRPQVLNDRCSNPDSSGYIDDASVRDNSEEMYSLDNDSFLNSLEAMTIQNYWTDTVKHTKL